MARTIDFLVPVASGPSPYPIPQSHYNKSWVAPTIGDVPHACPAKSATQASIGEYPSVVMPITWQKNWTFRLGLKFDHISSHNSNVCVFLKDQQTGKRYQIHPDIYRQMMWQSTWVYGVVVEDWTWEKRGRFIFLCPAYI